VKTEQPNTLVIRLDDYVASQELPGGEAAQEVALNPSDFQNAKGELMASWLGASQLEIAPYISVRSRFNHNGIVKSEKLERGTRNWKGSAPEFISLRWQ